MGLSTRRGSEDAPRPAARDVPNSSRRRPAHRPRATSYATSGADCPSPDTVVLVFMVASQSRLSTQPNLSAPRVASTSPNNVQLSRPKRPDRRSRERIRADTERVRLNVGGYHIPPGLGREAKVGPGHVRRLRRTRGVASSASSAVTKSWSKPHVRKSTDAWSCHLFESWLHKGCVTRAS